MKTEATKVIAFNIETMANPKMVHLLPEPDVKLGNIKNPALIKDKKDQAKARLHGKMALDPYFGEIICITLAMVVDNVVRKVTRLVGVDGTESELLRIVWEKLSSPSVRSIITFNGAGFDIPFMQRRSLLLGVPFPTFETSKYRVGNIDSHHIDMMRVLEMDQNPMAVSHGLKFYVRQIFDTDFPFEELDQSQLGELIKTEKGNQIVAALCEWNTEYTLRLFNRVNALQS